MLLRPTRSLLMFMILTIVLALLFLGGCAGDSARVRALGPAMSDAWPGVREDAELGVRAREDAAAAAALRVENEDATVARLRRERILQFGGAVDKLNRK